MMSHDSDMAAHGEAGGRQGREALQVVSVKIIDFGLARELSSTSLLTGENVVCPRCFKMSWHVCGQGAWRVRLGVARQDVC